MRNRCNRHHRGGSCGCQRLIIVQSPQCPQCPPCPPCPPPEPCPPCPVTETNFLAAAGTGRDLFVFITLTADIPFGPTLASIGNSVSHVANTPDFIILETGQYEINYQMSTYNPVTTALPNVDFTVRLISSVSGVVDTLNFTTAFQLMQRHIILNLSAGETLRFQITQAEPSEMSVNSQAIVFTKLQ